MSIEVEFDSTWQIYEKSLIYKFFINFILDVRCSSVT